MTPEDRVLKPALARIRHFGGEARKVHGSRFSQGEPDIDAVLWGVPLKVECKAKGGKPTGLQAARLKAWERAGAVTGWIDDPAQIDELILRCFMRLNGVTSHKPIIPLDVMDEIREMA